MPRFLMLRFSLFYICMFLFLGVQLPFFPLWLEGRGFSEIDIGFLLAGATIVRAAFGPITAFWVDRHIEQRRAVKIMAWLTFAATALLFYVSGKGSIFVFAILMLWAFGGVLPLSDVAAIRAERDAGLNYGRARAIGAIAFIAASIIGGLVISYFSSEAAILWMMVMAGAMALSAHALPKSIKPEPSVVPAGVALKRAATFFSQQNFLFFMGAIATIQASHAVYYAFSAIEWSRQGYSDLLIGALWSTGVLAEIIVLANTRKILNRFGAEGLLIIGAGAAIVRWAVTAFNPPLVILFPIQTLHALTFGATFVGSVYFVRENTPPELTNTAMMISSSIAVGAGMALATLLASPLYEHFASKAYILMFGFGVFGLGCAAMLLKRKGLNHEQDKRY